MEPQLPPHAFSIVLWWLHFNTCMTGVRMAPYSVSFHPAPGSHFISFWLLAHFRKGYWLLITCRCLRGICVHPFKVRRPIHFTWTVCRIKHRGDRRNFASGGGDPISASLRAPFSPQWEIGGTRGSRCQGVRRLGKPEHCMCTWCVIRAHRRGAGWQRFSSEHCSLNGCLHVASWRG